MEVYLVTHGNKFSGANPGMTSEGFQQIAELRHLLPHNPSAVVCGAGKRHLDVAAALGLKPTSYTGAAGGPESLEVIEGKRVVVLADGTQVPYELWTGIEDEKPAALALIAGLSDQAVVCAGRPLPIKLGKTDAKSAAVYRVTVNDVNIISVQEVVATGQTEAGTV